MIKTVEYVGFGAIISLPRNQRVIDLNTQKSIGERHQKVEFLKDGVSCDRIASTYEWTVV